VADPEAASGEPVLLVTEPDAMAALERKGFAVGDVFGERGTGPVDNARLALESRYASTVDVIAADVATIAQRDPRAGVGVHRFSHRLFDVRWLRQKSARFELVAVVNRMDRAPFHPQGCGETRLVYRLAYVTKWPRNSTLAGIARATNCSRVAPVSPTTMCPMTASTSRENGKMERSA
jgi:hypothetical protein